MPVLTEPIITDKTGREIVNALLQNDIVAQKTAEINAAADEKLAAVLAQIPPEYQTISAKIEKLETMTDAYVVPEMFGAVGDGENDDTAAVQEAMEHGLVLMSKTYKVSNLTLENVTIIGGTLKTTGVITVNSNTKIVFTNFDNAVARQLTAPTPIMNIYGENTEIDSCNFGGKLGGVCIATTYGSKNTHISKCRFAPCFRQDIRANGDDMYIVECTFDEHTSSSPSPASNYDNAIKLSSYNPEDPAGEEATTNPNGDNINIISCRMGLHGDNPIDGYTGATNVRVEGCHIVSVGVRCIEIKTKTSQIHINRQYAFKNNYLEGEGLIDVHSEVKNEPFSLSHVIIEGNIGKMTASSTSCIRCDCANVDISNNIFECNGSVAFTSTHDTLVQNCKILSCNTMFTVTDNDCTRHIVGCEVQATSYGRVTEHQRVFIDDCRMNLSGNAFSQVTGTLFVNNSHITSSTYTFVIASDHARIAATNCIFDANSILNKTASTITKEIVNMVSCQNNYTDVLANYEYTPNIPF